MVLFILTRLKIKCQVKHIFMSPEFLIVDLWIHGFIDLWILWIWDFWWWIYSWRRSTHYPDWLHYFSVTIPRCYKDACVNSFFPDTVILWNSLPRECFPLTCDLIGFNSRINRHLLTVGSFWTDFLYALIFLCFFFL